MPYRILSMNPTRLGVKLIDIWMGKSAAANFRFTLHTYDRSCQIRLVGPATQHTDLVHTCSLSASMSSIGNSRRSSSVDNTSERQMGHRFAFSAPELSHLMIHL